MEHFFSARSPSGSSLKTAYTRTYCVQNHLTLQYETSTKTGHLGNFFFFTIFLLAEGLAPSDHQHFIRNSLAGRPQGLTKNSTATNIYQIASTTKIICTVPYCIMPSALEGKKKKSLLFLVNSLDSTVKVMFV